MSAAPTLPGAIMKQVRQIGLPAWCLVAACLIALQAIIVYAQGHPLICTCGTIKLWGGAPANPENSQQIFDWYSFTHILHGFGFYLILYVFARRLPFGLRLVLAVGLEGAWEVLENSPVIIERYRQTALAQGYFGDSVLNSVSDTVTAVTGFVLARLLPAWLTVTLAVALEIFVGIEIRDNLTLNIIELIHPVEAISRWQAGGS
jgi:hypothetical protein